MILAENITKSYGDIHVLKGIDLLIQEGEIVSITGKSGAGKSTLLHILGTLDRPDTGALTIRNQNLNALKDEDLARFRNKHIGFVFQFHHLLQEFTAMENVCIPAFIQGKYGLETTKRAQELLTYLGLKGRESHKPSQLSGGEAQRVAVARALINQPCVVFADEPTGNLDRSSSDTLHELLLQMRKDFNQTFVIVTHNPELASLADRNIQIEDGHVVI
jgi:lipoprotein-releasing system ATP-binding protein